MKEKKLVYGVGINDADYPIQVKETIGYTLEGKQIQKQVWYCPFYLKWRAILERCYSNRNQIKNPTYIGCTVTVEWYRFSNFKSWMEKQDWEHKELDKDLLFKGNKVYGPETCLFVDPRVNLFVTERQNHRGDWPIGVHLHKKTGSFKSQCSDVLTGKQKHLGYFNTPEEAHDAWLTFKLEQAKLLADQQTDTRVAKALIDRYENYGD